MRSFRPSTNMSLYETAKPLNPFISGPQFKGIGAPPGTSLRPQLLELLKDIPDLLNLASIGISTPWASPVGDLNWKEIQNPDTNVQTFLLRDADIRRTQELLFGQTLPFVVIKTLDPVPRAELEAALRGSVYELFETQAVYRQDDPNPIPRIEFHHWAKRLGEGGGNRPMESVAVMLQGDLLFGIQVPVESTTLRQSPAVPFQMAFDAQFLTDPVVTPSPGVPSFPGVPQPPPSFPEFPPDLPSFPGPGPVAPGPEAPVTTPSKSATSPLWGPVLLAGAFTAAVLLLTRSKKR